MTGPPATEVDALVARWRAYVGQHAVMTAEDLDEMEDHLRGQVADLCGVGLSGAEAFLVAMTRLGAIHEISREFALEHSDRLWKQLATEPSGDGTTRRRELSVTVCLGAAAGITVKAGLVLLAETRFMVCAGLMVAPFLAAYFAWKRRLAVRPIIAVAAVFAALAVVAGTYPFGKAGDTTVLAVIHVPIVCWFVIGVAYAGARWRSRPRRMDFIRFTGEFLVYYVLLALGGGALIGLTIGSFAAVGIDATGIVGGWVLPFGIPGAMLVAAYLVEAKKQVIENMAPVLTRVFLPLTIIMLLALLTAYAVALTAPGADRTLLIMMDLVLVTVLGLVIYTISARRAGDTVGVVDWLLLAITVAALAVDVLVLAALANRIVEFGPSANKVTALGLNLLLLVNLAGSAWRSALIVRRHRPSGVLEAWQTRYLPYLGLWAAIVAVVIPPIFAFG